MRARNEKDIEYRRNSILEAAEQQFVEKGYDAITMEMIASVVQLNKRTLYLYYPNKNAIFQELFLRQSIDRIKYYRQEIGKSAGGLDVLRAFGVACYEYFKKYSFRHRLVLHIDIMNIWQEPSPDDENMKKLTQEYRELSEDNTTYMFNELKKDFKRGLTYFKDEDDIYLAIDQIYVCLRTVYNRYCCQMSETGTGYYYNFLERFIKGVTAPKTGKII